VLSTTEREHFQSEKGFLSTKTSKTTQGEGNREEGGGPEGANKG